MCYCVEHLICFKLKGKNHNNSVNYRRKTFHKYPKKCLKCHGEKRFTQMTKPGNRNVANFFFFFSQFKTFCQKPIVVHTHTSGYHLLYNFSAWPKLCVTSLTVLPQSHHYTQPTKLRSSSHIAKQSLDSYSDPLDPSVNSQCLHKLLHLSYSLTHPANAL